MELETIVQDIADVLKSIGSSRVPFKKFQPGVGPYGEPPLWKAFEVVAAAVLNIQLRSRIEAKRDGLVHPVHQRLVVVGWEIS
jgi:hypothetical protein